MLAGKQARNRSQDREYRSAQRNPGNPNFAAVFRASPLLFVQMLERHFRFFHAITCEARDCSSSGNQHRIDKSGETSFNSGGIPMSHPPTTSVVCQICKKTKSPNSGMIAELLRPSLLDFIKKRLPGFDSKGFICLDDLGEFRKEYVKGVLQDEIGELSALDQEVIESLKQHEILSANIDRQFERKLTFGERLSDRFAEFGGSWKFIISSLVHYSSAGLC